MIFGRLAKRCLAALDPIGRLAKRCLAALEQLEGALLGLVASLDEILERLLAERVLLLADNATLLGLHEVGLHQAAGRVLGRAMEDHGLRANGRRLRSLRSLTR